ncbi:MAG: T9SS type A sorting domain-containing protein [Mariniphaga sp.]|nr:T9SS type A sorting domain-containing protein [Mariniphaga sp.]
MKQILLLFLLIFTALNTIGQEYKYVPFPDSNAIWSEVFWKPISEPPPNWIYNQYALFNEDTLINGIIYNKLYHSTSTSKITRENSICIGGIREDSLKRVYASKCLFQVTPDVKEILLFDFSLNEGDTLFSSYGDSIFTYCLLGDEVIANVDTIKINDSYRKVFTFDNHNKIVWIEGIGSLQGLLICYSSWPTNGMSNDLVCMHQNDTLLYFNSGRNNIYNDCIPKFILNDIPTLPNLEINVYPNPVSDGIVYFDNLDFDYLELFDLNGNIIVSEDIRNANCFELNLKDFPLGVYSYILKSKGLLPIRGKLIIQ